MGLLVPAANATHLKVTRRPGTGGSEGRRREWGVREQPLVPSSQDRCDITAGSGNRDLKKFERSQRRGRRFS